MQLLLVCCMLLTEHSLRLRELVLPLLLPAVCLGPGLIELCLDNVNLLLGLLLNLTRLSNSRCYGVLFHEEALLWRSGSRTDAPTNVMQSGSCIVTGTLQTLEDDAVPGGLCCAARKAKEHTRPFIVCDGVDELDVGVGGIHVPRLPAGSRGGH